MLMSLTTVWISTLVKIFEVEYKRVEGGGGQCTYNVALMRVHVIIVATKKQ
jgi:hypothetical protein